MLRTLTEQVPTPLASVVPVQVPPFQLKTTGWSGMPFPVLRAVKVAEKVTLTSKTEPTTEIGAATSWEPPKVPCLLVQPAPVQGPHAGVAVATIAVPAKPRLANAMAEPAIPRPRRFFICPPFVPESLKATQSFHSKQLALQIQ